MINALAYNQSWPSWLTYSCPLTDIPGPAPVFRQYLTLIQLSLEHLFSTTCALVQSRRQSELSLRPMSAPLLLLRH